MTKDTSANADSAGEQKRAVDPQYQWLAHELHDGLLQWVVGARMQVEAALVKLDQESALSLNLHQAVSHLLNALAEGRSLIGFLENQELGECDTVKEITDFVDSVQSLVLARGQTLRLETPHPNWPELPKQQAWSLLRFVQQAIQNAIQHAGPTDIVVQLDWVQTSTPKPLIVARIADQGSGFDPTQAVPAGHIGLQSLQHRANMSGGCMNLEAAPGQGCRVALLLPLTV